MKKNYLFGSTSYYWIKFLQV